MLRADLTEDRIVTHHAQIMTNFGASKTDLNLKYRLGLEHALAKADFLNAPDIILVQAFAIFLCVGRRHDSPRFVYMMTGLVIRMAQYLGLQRDGSHFEHLTPFEIEMRRKVWWIVCHLDLRASEDQGTDVTIMCGSFDTKIPLNINDADINLESEQLPTERDGVTDMSFPRIFAALCDIMRQMMGPGMRNGAAGLEDQSRMLDEIYKKYEQGYFQYTTESGDIAYWVGVTIARLTMAKMKLIVFLPVLFSSPNEHFSDRTRTELLVSAIEVAEYNHALNAEQSCRQWRWIYQTYTHWHAIVYLLIEISRRPWSPIVERAWVALHSSWLIPAQTSMDKKLRIWVPLRQLMAKARKHRDTELKRLRADAQAAARLDMEDQRIPSPLSTSHFSTGSSVHSFRERWRQLVSMPEGHGHGTQASGLPGVGLTDPSIRIAYASQQNAKSVSRDTPADLTSNITFRPTDLGTSDQQVGQLPESANCRDLEPVITTKAPSEMALGQTGGTSYSPSPMLSADLSAVRTVGLDSVPLLWADADPSVDMFANLDMDLIDVNMDLDGKIDWCEWVESARGMEWEARPSGSDRV